jgi:hypothetical protein
MGIKPPPKEPHQPKPHPFKALARHERWCVDIRYIEKHRIPEFKDSFYVITVGIFRSDEGQFHIINVMRRMSQVHFEQVTSWQGAKLAHERLVTDYNAQPHWAHRKREDNRLSPAEVLGQQTSKLRTPEQLHRIFYATRFLRRLDRLGYAHFRRWKLYEEEALARYPAVIWLHGDALTVEYEETSLAQYTVRYQLDKKHFKAIPVAKRFETPYRSPQGWLWELDDTMWYLAKRLPDYALRKRRQKKGVSIQLPLPGKRSSFFTAMHGKINPYAMS